MLVFDFQPRWKEELVCSCPLGSFVLEMPMGDPSVYLPPKDSWPTKCPPWAASHWEELHEQLATWCARSSFELRIDETAWAGGEKMPP